ncbi:RadC family protein [Caldisalinibacter kiritimatiensis]|uniref:DNA repair protein RadC n=1 Tax=Caldisalinibacter kiritimatiensis TaxID=1304284 RepID=R1CT01_9FIRM|nr:DNA repair protein RadC [Caldisalinibacter kiritimatiensis]EOC99828.1 DNA repair protein RadC [Caldisalinibacter kiritimatiensis]
MGDYTSYTIKDLPEDERPREKLYKYGSKVLSNSELLAIIIRTGNKEDTAIGISQRMLALNNKGLQFLAEAEIGDLTRIKGVGKCKAAQILAAIELGRRISKTVAKEKVKVNSPLHVANLVMEDMRYLKKEYFKIILLDTKNQVITINEISVGSLNASIVHPREVFKEAILKSSASIILVHNHPSGDPTPSREDINITNRIIEAGKIIGIDVLDHIVIGDGIYFSFKEENLI